MLRKRTVVKLLIGIPIVWILVMFFVGFNDGSSDQQVEIEKAKVKQLEEQKKELIAAAALKHEDERRKFNEQKHLNLENNQGDDHDHPEEEIIKAQQQQNEQAGPIQVHAPDQHDPNAPGNLIFFIFIFLQTSERKFNS